METIFNIYFWIHISLVFALGLDKVSNAGSSQPDMAQMRRKWDECCERSTCIRNSCYFMEWGPSGWPSVRQRCQSQYPDWPYAIDIFHIQDEQDLNIFWTMLQDPDVPLKNYPRTIWTGGARCPKASSNETKFINRWISTNQHFPSWLNDRISALLNNSVDKESDCKFLVIAPASNDSNVKYDFQDQNARHSTICEFRFPGEIEVVSTTSSPNQTADTTTLTEISVTIEFDREKHTSSQQSTTRFIYSSFTHSPSTQTVSSPSGKGHIITDKSPVQETEDSTISIASTAAARYCKGLSSGGIRWPDTLEGKTAIMKCPEGMTGAAVWQCDATTLKFQPEKPIMEGCKHEWIENLEDSIREGHDAVEISSKLAKETREKTVSHGDIIALVNLTSNLLQLYMKQKGEEEFEVSINEELPVYFNFTKTMISSISNILRLEIKDAWEGLNETRQTREASTILKLVTNIGSRLSCIKTSTDKLQFTVSEENIDLQTFILNNVKDRDAAIVFPEETKEVKSSSYISLPVSLNLSKWFSPCKTYNSAVGVIYKNVGDFLKAGQLESSNTKVMTKVISFSLGNTTKTISLARGKVNITLQHVLQETVQNQILRNPRCVFWNFSKSTFGEWDDSGCDVLSFNETHTVCQCDHLTNFAVLMDINYNTEEDKLLSMMTYICCGVSSLTLVVTLICFLSIRSLHGRRSIITGNLCFSLLVTNILIIFGLDKTQHKILCAVVAGVLHFWILSAFCWMLVEGYHLYRMVILVFQRGSNLPVKFYYLFAYGTPLIVVGISAGIRNSGYGGSKYCWLSKTDGLMWSFVGPACAIILVNMVIFILTLRSASSVKIKREQSSIKKIKSWIRGSISVMCLLGLTWCIGLFYIDKKLNFFSYIFTVLNGLQGVFIFLFHILLNEKIGRAFFCSWKENKQYGGRKCLNQTLSNQIHSKTSTRTSTNSIGCTSSTKISSTKSMTNTSTPLKSYIASKKGSDVLQQTPKQNSSNYRKNKVVHVMSDTGVKRQTSSYNGEVRSKSFSE